MSANTVFYAWQSDLPPEVNRYFIREAAEAAIKALRKELAVEQAPRLDHDTKGEPGLPDIFQTILEKIDNCAVFLADISFVAQTTPSNGDAKLIPNPNVLIELGYALGSVGPKRIVTVLNTAFGKAESLPFDLRNRRHPITYHLASKGDPNFKKVESALTDNLKIAIRTILEHSLSAGGELEAVKQAERRRRVSEARKSFEQLALTNQFHRFEPERGVILVSIIPEQPLSPVLNLSDETLVRSIRLRNVHGPVHIPEIRGRALVAKTLARERPNPISATELREDGTLFSADGFLLSSAPTDRMKAQFKETVTGYIPCEAFEEDLVASIRSYLLLVRKIGVKGTLHVSIAFHRVHGFLMAVGDLRAEFHHRTRLCETNSIEPDPVVFGEDSDISSDSSVARKLKPIFDFVWRELGYPSSWNFDEKGEWHLC